MALLPRLRPAFLIYLVSWSQSRQLPQGGFGMILSVSRRTDIPAFYADWWYRRVDEGFVLVPDPYDPQHISRVTLSPSAVDCIVFWSKDPAPMLPRLSELDARGYLYYFTFTITGWGNALEPGAPDTAAAIDTFRTLSGLLGPARVDWRFDPILLGGERTPERVAKQFARLCAQLAPLTTRCILSFADPYAHLDKSLPRPPDDGQIRDTAALLAPVAKRYGLPLFTCAERADLSSFGIQKGACIDPDKISRLLGCALEAVKDPGQRKACGCVQSVDVGVYDTCPGGCRYCYATPHPAAAARRCQAHDPAAPMLTGWPRGDEKITDRPMPPLSGGQLTLW